MVFSFFLSFVTVDSFLLYWIMQRSWSRAGGTPWANFEQTRQTDVTDSGPLKENSSVVLDKKRNLLVSLCLLNCSCVQQTTKNSLQGYTLVVLYSPFKATGENDTPLISSPVLHNKAKVP